MKTQIQIAIRKLTESIDLIMKHYKTTELEVNLNNLSERDSEIYVNLFDTREILREVQS